MYTLLVIKVQRYGIKYRFNLEHCIAFIRLWMTQNILRLNDNITNIIYFASSYYVKFLETPALQYTFRSIMYEHVTSVYRAAYYQLKNIRCLKTFLTQESHVALVVTFVASHIDYCNYLLYDIFDYNINLLQILSDFTKNYIGYLLDNVSISRFYCQDNRAPGCLYELVSIRKSSPKSGHPFRICMSTPSSRP